MLGTQTISIGRIEFLSSLPADQMQTARRVHEEVNDAVFSEEAPIEVNFSEVLTRARFFETLTELAAQADRDGKGIVLQIDAHGATDGSGIVLASNELVIWEELRTPSTELNRVTRMNLMVVLSLCHGAHFVAQMEPTDRAPFWALVGPTGEVCAGLLADGLTAFYRTWIKTKDGDKAVAELNKYTRPGDPEFYFTTAEKFFGAVYRKYLQTFSTDAKTIADQARSLHRKWKKQGIKEIPSVGNIKRNLKSGHRDFFAESKRKFFMIDLFPDNSGRFGIELSDILASM